jgi:serine/threonine-protein kinase
MDPTPTRTAPPHPTDVATLPHEPAPDAVRPAGANTRADREFLDLLRRRLRVVGVLLSAAHLCFAVVGVVEWVTKPVGPGYGPAMVFYLSITFILVAASAALWSPRPLPLPALRTVELVLVGLAALYQAVTMPRNLVVEGLMDQGYRAGVTVASFFTLNWFAIVVGYGVLVPNTGGRTARVVGVLAAVPVGLYFACGLVADGVWPGYRQELVIDTVVFAVFMAVGAAIAVYGSHRIETLRREAVAARRLGQYVLREKLGGGGMGEVYRADHALLRRPAAIKLIRPEKAGDPVHLARFEREVQATATLTHPNTVHIYDYGRADDGTFYCVMEYLPGPTLDQLVRRDGPLPPGRAVHFLRQLCGALREAHAIGLIHRDVKPGNVVVCDRGGVADVAKLLDFGLVLPVGLGRDGEKLTAEGAVFGTPAFMSPEQADGRDDLDARSDVYSLGCVAYFLLTGRPPFADRSPVKMLAAHLYEQPQPPAGVPADLAAVVLRCLAKAPADRFPDVASLDAALAGADL